VCHSTDTLHRTEDLASSGFSEKERNGWRLAGKGRREAKPGIVTSQVKRPRARLLTFLGLRDGPGPERPVENGKSGQDDAGESRNLHQVLDVLDASSELGPVDERPWYDLRVRWIIRLSGVRGRHCLRLRVIGWSRR